MLCLRTSRRHTSRCLAPPRLATPTPSSSSSLSSARAHVSSRRLRSSRRRARPGPREPRPSCESAEWPLAGPRRRRRWRKRVVDRRRLRARAGAGPARRPGRAETNLPHRYAATRRASRRVGAAEGFVSVAPGLGPAKAATAPVIGIIIEFLPTDPCQTARGDSCARRDTTERHKLAQLRPVHGLHAHRL